MKITYVLVLLIGGFSVCLVGSLMKIMHWPASGIVLLTGLAGQATGILGFLVKLLRPPQPE